MGERANVPATAEAVLNEACDVYRARVPRGWDVPVNAAVAAPGGRIVASTDPGGAASMARTIAAMAEYFDGEWVAGDVAITNDVFAGNSLACEFTAIAPASAGRWCAIRTEVPDIGGWAVGGRASRALDTWSEGARITPVKLSTAGELRREVRQIVMLNSRTPRLNDACMRAIHAAAAHLTAAPALGPLEDGRIPASLESILHTLAERNWRAAISIPLPFGEQATIRVETVIRVGGDKLTVSFPNPPPASPFPVNATRWMTADAVNRAIAASFDLDPNSAIALSARTEIEVQEGGLLAARWPVTVGFGRAIAGRAVFSAVLEALASVAQSTDLDILWRARGAHPSDRFIDWQRLALAAERRRTIEAIESELEP